MSSPPVDIGGEKAAPPKENQRRTGETSLRRFRRLIDHRLKGVSLLAQSAKVLVVDDEPNVLRSLVQYLTIEEFTVETASNGMEALEKVDSFNPELILLDVMMPGMDGFEVLDKVKEKPGHSNTPVIMLTAKDQSADVLKGYQSGATSYLVKPFNLDELVETINQTLERSKSASE
jgi:DNA-binding response OmpR family regulator